MVCFLVNGFPIVTGLFTLFNRFLVVVGLFVNGIPVAPVSSCVKTCRFEILLFSLSNLLVPTVTGGLFVYCIGIFKRFEKSLKLEISVKLILAMLIDISVVFFFVLQVKYTYSSLMSTKDDGAQEKSGENRRVLLISLDGFGWDYMNKTFTPNLDYIARTGVQAEYLRSSFPTTTYPNHFTMVTGLYPESHGIIANYMRDPELKGRFNIYNTDPKWWGAFGAVPLWITNQDQGGRSAVMHWPGYNVPFEGKTPDLNLESPSFNIDLRNKSGKVISYDARIDLLMKWLTSENPPNFIAMYLEEPDEVGHRYGPRSKEVKSMIRKLDSVIGEVLMRLRSNKMLDSTNIIVVSDHGMREISSSRQEFVDNYVNPHDYDIWDESTNLMVEPRDKKHKEDIYEQFKQIPHVKVYWKADIPKRFHFANNRRVPEIFVMAKDGWEITGGKPPKKPKKWIKGNHGFSNEDKSQRGFFIGRGPAFRMGYKAEGFDNIHLYPLICKLLGVTPRPNNGTLAATNDMLRSDFDG